jgi:hypothetical protein
VASPTIPDISSFASGTSPLSRRQQSYPHNMFNLAQAHLPDNVRDIYDLCAYYFSTSSLVHPVVQKISEYAITHFHYESNDDESVRRVKRMFEKTWHMRHTCIEIGLYYNTFGNGFAPIMYALRRFLVCEKCDKRHHVRKVKFKWQNYEFHGRCPNCSHDGKFRVRDIYPRSPEFVRPVIFDPRNVYTKRNPITGHIHYFYSIPSEIKARIRRGDPYMLEDTPWVFVQAVKHNRRVDLNRDTLYHFSRPGLSASNEGLGMPLIQPVMQDVFYRGTLKRAQEAIALQHIVPLMILFPQGVNNVSAPKQYNLGDWKNKVENEIRKWKVDPNYIPVMPLPAGSLSLGGDARALMITPELDHNQGNIINGMGMPVDILTGGMTWSGGSISMRMIENMLVNYRENIDEYLEFAADKAYSYLGWDKVPVSLMPFRMADDIQRLQIMSGARAQGDISVGRYLEELGEDHTKEHERRMKELTDEQEYLTEQMRGQATAQGEAGIVAARYQQKAQSAMLQEQEDEVQEEVESQGVPMDDPRGLVTLLAEMILSSEGQEQQYALEQLQGMPNLAQMVYEEMDMLVNGQQQEEGMAMGGEPQETGGGTDQFAMEVDDAPPEILPPRSGL